MSKKKGFTLIELVVVMAIIAVLALLIVAAIAAARRQATTTQRIGNLKTIETALESRASKCGGMYFAASGDCAAVSTTNIGTIQDNLVTQGYLTQSLGLTGAESGYSIISTSAVDNTFEIRACNAPATSCTGTSNIGYTALR